VWTRRKKKYCANRSGIITRDHNTLKTHSHVISFIRKCAVSHDAMHVDRNPLNRAYTHFLNYIPRICRVHVHHIYMIRSDRYVVFMRDSCGSYRQHHNHASARKYIFSRGQSCRTSFPYFSREITLRLGELNSDFRSCGKARRKKERGGRERVTNILISMIK